MIISSTYVASMNVRKERPGALRAGLECLRGPGAVLKNFGLADEAARLAEHELPAAYQLAEKYRGTNADVLQRELPSGELGHVSLQALRRAASAVEPTDATTPYSPEALRLALDRRDKHSRTIEGVARQVGANVTRALHGQNLLAATHVGPNDAVTPDLVADIARFNGLPGTSDYTDPHPGIDITGINTLYDPTRRLVATTVSVATALSEGDVPLAFSVSHSVQQRELQYRPAITSPE